MKKRNMSIFRRIFLYVGICTFAVGIILLAISIYNIHSSPQQSASYVNTIKTLIPEPQGAALGKRNDNNMPTLSIDGTDFVGILEMPAHGSVLPVGADWKRPTKYPHCLSGSIYDGSIQIGGTTQTGQYDFYREISVGEKVYFTDMTGNRYGYTVTSIKYEKHADQATLKNENASLTLFIKIAYGFEYVIIYCDY